MDGSNYGRTLLSIRVPASRDPLKGPLKCALMFNVFTSSVCSVRSLRFRGFIAFPCVHYATTFVFAENESQIDADWHALMENSDA